MAPASLYSHVIRSNYSYKTKPLQREELYPAVLWHSWEPGGDGAQGEYSGAAGSRELIIFHIQGISYTVSDSSQRLVDNSEQEHDVLFHVVRCMDAISGIIPEKWLVSIC